MLGQSTLISYHTEAFVKTEVGCTVYMITLMPSHCVLQLLLTQTKNSKGETFFPTYYDAKQVRISQEKHLLTDFPLSF